jgi:hypothetical protein
MACIDITSMLDSSLDRAIQGSPVGTIRLFNESSSAILPQQEYRFLLG